MERLRGHGWIKSISCVMAGTKLKSLSARTGRFLQTHLLANMGVTNEYGEENVLVVWGLVLIRVVAILEGQMDKTRIRVRQWAIERSTGGCRSRIGKIVRHLCLVNANAVLVLRTR